MPFFFSASIASVTSIIKVCCSSGLVGKSITLTTRRMNRYVPKANAKYRGAKIMHEQMEDGGENKAATQTDRDEARVSKMS